jgi:hypothetical protein
MNSFMAGRKRQIALAAFSRSKPEAWKPGGGSG